MQRALRSLTFLILPALLTIWFFTQAAPAAAQPPPDRCPGAQFVIPTSGKLGWSYNYPDSQNPPGLPDIHTGIDILGATTDLVVAPYAGVVTRYVPRSGAPLAATFHISHTELGVETYYAHMDEVYVTRSGQEVQQGEVIGSKGTVGTDILHLHFSVHKPGADERNIANVYDPSSYLAAQVNYNAGAKEWGRWTIRELCYTQQAEPVTVVLIIDSTGSMRDNDPTNLRRQAAKVFIDTARVGDRIAIVAFDASAEVLSALRTIETDADRSALKAAVDLVDSSGTTNLNRGLDAGYAQLQNDASTARKVALLLTDGLQEANEPYYQRSHLQYQARGWAVYAIGLSDNVDELLLAKIAADTKGTYSQLQKAADLQSKYFEVSQLLNKGSMLLQQRQMLANGDQSSLAVAVPAQQTSASFFVAWPGSNVQTTLTSPTGRLISPAQLGSNVQHSKGATYELYTVAYPEPGKWAVNLYGAQLAPAGEPVDVRVSSVGVAYLYMPALASESGFPSMPDEPLPPVFAPANPFPAPGAVVDITGNFQTLDLTWDDADPLRTFPLYDFYFGASNPPPRVTAEQGGAIHYLDNLQPGVTYYWQVASINARGERIAGPVWTFTTQSPQPLSPTIGFVSDRSGNPDIYRAMLNGNGLQQLTTDPGRDEGPSWSPDGSQIVFHSTRAGYFQLYVMNADGSNQRRLVTSSAIDESAYWSPAGDRIAFSRVADHDANGQVHTEVFMVDADGGNPRRITFTYGKTGDFVHGCWPSGWSSDGAKLLFYCYVGKNNLYMVDANGNNPVILLDNDTWNSIPTISPDGARVAFSSFRNNNYDVYLLDRTSGAQTQLTSEPSLDWRPVWSPAGNAILFESDRSGSTQIYTMNVDGSDVRPVPVGLGNNSHAAWMP
jgi:Tol biopolymer transport system component/murein DD-endopeptidase MepM/ murein hydrolase activator NlpD